MVLSSVPDAIDHVDLITEWPGNKRGSAQKVPSKISYNVGAEADHTVGKSSSDTASQKPNSSSIIMSTSRRRNHRPQNVRWGYQLNLTEPCLQYFKLFLAESMELPEFLSQHDTEKEMSHNNRRNVDVATDFLAKLNEHIKSALSKRYSEGFLNRTPRQYVLTVPAIWPEVAKTLTTIAAQRAGMGQNIKLIAEPEAAAVSSLRAFRQHSLQRGDSIIICDAGGGTVDLISYLIQDLNPLKMKEMATGGGDLCGSSFLNSSFEKLLKDILGTEKHEALIKSHPDAINGALRSFEDMKKDLEPDDDTGSVEFLLKGASDDESVGIKNTHIQIPKFKLHQIFQDIMEKIIVLVEEQVGQVQRKGRTISAILLVGGFGQSFYLHQVLERHFHKPGVQPQGYQASKRQRVSYADERIPVYQSQDAQSAVVRGAVTRYLQDSTVTGRHSRYHLGTKCSLEFEEGIHAPESRYLDKVTGEAWAKNVMDWFVHKGDEIHADKAIKLQFTKEFLEDATLVYRDAIYACSAEKAPAMFSNMMTKVCIFEADLSAVPPHYFKTDRNSDGEEIRSLDFDVEVWIESASFSLSISVDGDSYGFVEADFECEI